MDEYRNAGGEQQILEQHIDTLLHSSNPAERCAAAMALGECCNIEAIPPLLAAFYDPEKGVRAQASEAVAMLGKPAVGPLTDMLRAKSWVVRYRTIEALSRIEDSTTVEPLVHALEDPVDHVRYMSSKALGCIGDPRAIEPLTAVLRDENEFVRRSAAMALWKTAGEEAHGALTEALQCEECEGVRRTIEGILEEIRQGRED